MQGVTGTQRQSAVGAADRSGTCARPDGFGDVDVFGLAAVGMVITDRGGRFRRVNAAFAALVGRSVDELLGTSFSALTSPDDVGRSQAVMRALLTKATETACFEKRYLRPDGALIWVELNIRSLTDDDGAVVAFLASGADVTARKVVEAELIRAAEDTQRLALVARATSSAVVIADPGGRIQWVNDAFTRQSGYRPEEAVGRSRVELLHGPSSGSDELAAFGELLSRGEPADGDFHLTATDGRPYVANVQVRPVIEDGVVTHLIGVERDVTQRHQAEEALRIARTRAEWLAEALTLETELLGSVISAVPQMVFWKDRARHYVGCNTAYLGFRGCSDVAGLRALEETGLGPVAETTRLLTELETEVLASGAAVIDRQVTVSDPAGLPRVLLLSVLPPGPASAGGRGIIGVVADVTQVREMEQKLAQASRLESIGQLAAGIAHEINTPVQYITSNTSFLVEATTDFIATAGDIAQLSHDLDQTGADPVAGRARLRELVDRLDLAGLQDDVPSALRESQEGLTRLTQIVRAMKDYAHPGTALQDSDINQAIETTTQVCRNEWKYVARLELDLDPDAGLVPCYAGELKQVILNIVVNAAHALAEQRADATLGLGRITVSTRRERDEIVIRIADDGPGMPESVRERIFDPFFTTKGVGKGTGQGLSMARSVVVGKHHGRLEVTSTAGCGAEFVIGLPLSATPDPEDG
jgi:two-component system NtrC family sensor kinase